MNRCLFKLRQCVPIKCLVTKSPFAATSVSLLKTGGIPATVNTAIQQTVWRPEVRNFHSGVSFWHYDKVDLSKENCMFYDDFKYGVENDKVLVFDVRTQAEVDRGRVPAKRFIHVHVEELDDALKNLSDEEFKTKYGAERPDRNATDLVFFCRLGIRSSRAVRIAREAGYEMPRHYPGGWAVWNERSQSDR